MNTKAKDPKTSAVHKLTNKTNQQILSSSAENIKPFNFINYLWRNRNNRRYLLAALLLNAVMFLAYKYYYPLPDFCSDAQGYIYAASLDIKSFYRPFGYSRFLQIVHNFTDSHYATVTIQYVILVIAALFSFFSVDYLYPFKSKTIKFCSWLLVTVNPCLLVLANLIMSDALFIAFSAIWFTLFLWIIRRKHWWSLLAQLFFLYVGFQIRYNALYYPIITGLIFLLVPKLKTPYRLTGIFTSFILILGAYTTIKKTTYKDTGANVFAGFNGWQIANNALMIYKRADIRIKDFDEPELRLLDQFAKHYIDSMSLESRTQIEKGEVSGAPFLWDVNGPLKKYVFYYAHTYKMSYLPAWYQVAPLYNKYGSYIIKNNPGLFFRYYLLPNFYQYFVPPLEVVAHYNLRNNELSSTTLKWFQIKTAHVKVSVSDVQEKLMYPYPVLHALLLLFCLVIPLIYLWKCRRKQSSWSTSFVVPALLWYLFLCADMAFNTFASPITLRYVALLFIIGFGLPFYFLDQILYKGKVRTRLIQ
jgi:hypothetical protein